MSDMENAPRLMTVSEVAKWLGVHQESVYRLIRERRLPGVVRFGRTVRVREDRLLEWLAEREVPSR